MDQQEKPDLALAYFTLVAVVIACVAASLVTAPLYALLGQVPGLPAPLRFVIALAVWYAGFKVSQAVIGRLFERSATVRRATTPRAPEAKHQSWRPR